MAVEPKTVEQLPSLRVTVRSDDSRRPDGWRVVETMLLDWLQLSPGGVTASGASPATSARTTRSTSASSPQ